MAIADLIIINKTDLLKTKELADIKKAIRLVNPKVRLLTSSHGQVDFRLLLNLDEKPSSQLNLKAPSNHDHHHLHDEFQTVNLSTSEPLDPKKFEAWAENLNVNIFRAKGILFFGMKGLGQKYIFQAVGERYELKLDEWEFDQTPKSDLVVIGTDLNEREN